MKDEIYLVITLSILTVSAVVLFCCSIYFIDYTLLSRVKISATNDKIINQAQKCEAAGLKAFISISDLGAMSVECHTKWWMK